MKKLLLLFICSFILIGFSYSQGYKTYHEALESFKSNSKSKGFSAIEAKYTHCKNLKSATIGDVEETPNEYTGRMDVDITWDYSYVGCYIGYNSYKGTAKVKGFIVRNESGRFEYGERGVSVLYYDPEK